jgi:L-alanine-DL-glutamate epimerase-like enolase superfamily enzyme
VVYANTVAKAAVDYALHDIMGKTLGVPLYRILGGKFCDRIPVRASVGIGDPDEMARKAAHCRELGFTGIKMKVGLEPMLDIERVKAIRKATGSDTLIDIDVNGAYSPKDAIFVLKRVQDCGNIIVEQPVHRDDISGMAHVRRSVDVPIGACESALTQQQIIRIIKMEAADFVNYKMSRSGGIFPAKQSIRMIEAAGLFVIASEQLGSSVELSANGHMAVSTMSLSETWPNGYGAGLMGMAGKFDNVDSDTDIVDRPLLIKDGYFYGPNDSPGLGVNLVEEKYMRYLTEGKDIIKLGKCV